MIGVIHYRAGNLLNLTNALRHIGQTPRVFDRAEGLERCDRIILPGVGAFGHAASNLERYGFRDAILDYARSGKPVLGICVGMQLLFDKSFEMGEHYGLGLISGDARRFEATLKVPQIGWNTVRQIKSNPLHAGIDDDSWFYFVHSYYCRPDTPEHQIGMTEYDQSFCSLVCRDNIHGAQFHPEKSQKAGLRLLENFCALP